MKKTLKQVIQLSSSEKLWRICPQPPNTCPMIDDLLEELQNLIKTSQSAHQELGELSIEYHCPICQNQAQDLLKTLHEQKIHQLEEQIKDLKKLFLELENFRDACLEIRELGQAQKDFLWDFLEKSLIINPTQKTFKISSHKLQRVQSTINKKFNLINALKRFQKTKKPVKPYSCECLNYQKKINRKLNQKKLEVKFNNPKLFEDILNNYQKINYWAVEILKLSDTKVLGIIRDQLVKNNFRSL